MCSLRFSHLQAATELLYTNEQTQLEIELLPKNFPKGTRATVSTTNNRNFQDAVGNTTYWIRICQLFRSKGTRRATVAAAVVMICQQLCGM